VEVGNMFSAREKYIENEENIGKFMEVENPI
jgi:hypothetical protein